MPIRIAKFEKIDTPQAQVYFAVHKTEDSRGLLLQATVPLDNTTADLQDEALCDLAWEQVKTRAEAYLNDLDEPIMQQHPLTNTDYVPK